MPVSAWRNGRSGRFALLTELVERSAVSHDVFDRYARLRRDAGQSIRKLDDVTLVCRTGRAEFVDRRTDTDHRVLDSVFLFQIEYVDQLADFIQRFLGVPAQVLAQRDVDLVGRTDKAFHILQRRKSQFAGHSGQIEQFKLRRSGIDPLQAVRECLGLLFGQSSRLHHVRQLVVVFGKSRSGSVHTRNHAENRKSSGRQKSDVLIHALGHFADRQIRVGRFLFQGDQSIGNHLNLIARLNPLLASGDRGITDTGELRQFLLKVRDAHFLELHTFPQQRDTFLSGFDTGIIPVDSGFVRRILCRIGLTLLFQLLLLGRELGYGGPRIDDRPLQLIDFFPSPIAVDDDIQHEILLA